MIILKIEITPLIGVVKFFSNEKNFGFAIVEGKEHFFHLDGQARAAIRLSNRKSEEHVILTLYVGRGETQGENFFFPKKGDKIFIFSQKGSKIIFWTSKEEFLPKMKILQRLKNGEKQPRFFSKDEDRFGCTWGSKSLIYTDEKEPLARDGYLRRITLENGIAVPSKGTFDYPNFFYIIEELRWREDGEYLFNEILKRYEKI